VLLLSRGLCTAYSLSECVRCTVLFSFRRALFSRAGVLGGRGVILMRIFFNYSFLFCFLCFRFPAVRFGRVSAVVRRDQLPSALARL